MVDEPMGASETSLQPIAPDSAIKDAEGNKQPKYTRLTRTEEAQIVRLAHDGLTQMQIAAALGRAQSTVSEVLSEYTPTVDLAKLRAEAASLQVVTDVIDATPAALRQGNTKPAEIVLGIAGLLKKADEGAKTAVQVVVGMPGQTAYCDPLAEG
jgi:transcriptional regulator with XRE-family HTH domain